LGITTLYNEQELTALLKNKDQAAFARLYDNYSGAIYSIILQIVNDEELANDILQEVFINIWRKIEMYDAEKGRLFTWMLNIARNASIDMLRSRGYRNSKKNQSIQENVDITVPGNTEQMNVDSIGLKKLLEKLKPEQRVLIDLSYFKGYTHEEIAEQENIPLGTVKTRIRNALIQLREILK
jgi:RNA polymerase sigma factor (sigma-70 family)